MLFNLTKPIFKLTSILMVVGMLAPSIIRLGHTLYQHSQEEKCIAYGTNHIHKSNLGCDFHDFTLTNLVLFNASFNHLLVDVSEIRYSIANYTFIYTPLKISFQGLRAPPAVS
ncbi:MAG: hypothetical protein CMH46_10970 [Muricauda sp.]|nr:hypothetical protein [Allomuricauda sp.]|tara:strand:+ start:19700 stop:20038 length:339 start_codon:yes stop_codon:yes gene_type:complete